jgi:hypothetical protein
MAVSWGNDPGGQMAVALAALDSAAPVATLRGEWPHVDEGRCARFVAEATPLQNTGNTEQLELAARRFLHDVNATWPLLPPEPRRTVLRRIRDLFKWVRS